MIKTPNFLFLYILLLTQFAFGQVSFVKTEVPYGGGGQLVIDGKDNLYCSTSGGLYISTNNGNSWQCIKEDFYYAKICVNKEGVVLAVTRDTIFLSKDKGKTWEKKEQSIPEARCLALDSKNNIFIGTEGGLYVYYYEEGEITKINAVSERINAFIIDNKDIVYVATKGGVFYSYDKENKFNYIGLKEYQGIDGEGITSLAINENGDVYAGSYEGLFFYSVDNKKWSKIEEAPGSFALVAIAGISIDPIGRIYISQYGEGGDVLSFVSTDNGKTLKYLNAPKVKSFIFSSQGQIFSSDNSNIYSFTDLGESWTILKNGITARYIEDIKIDSNGMWYLMSKGEIFKSLDKGTTWITVEWKSKYTDWTQMSLNSQGNFYLYKRFESDGFPAGDDYNMYLGYEILYSTDKGNIWQSIKGDPKIEIVSMGIDNRYNIYLLSESENKIYRLGNNGKKPTFFCNMPEGDHWYSKILFTPNNEIYFFTYTALYYSSDQGKKWTKLNLIPTIEDVEIMKNGDIFALITNSEERSSLYLSKDTGKNWEKFLELPENMGSINCFAFDDEGYLLCGTYGRGLWKSEKPVLK